MKKQERKLTVSYRYVNRAYQELVMIPEIRLTGKWLKKSGFGEGQKVNVMVEEKKLIITLDENE
jgi:hypothetical protein